MDHDISNDAGIELGQTNIRAVSVVPIFGLALFASAALLFWVQPLIAKMLLPLLGGVPSVWNTCMMFFQALLLAGYAYALLISQRLSLRNQAIVHTLVLLGAALVLPFALSNRVLSSLPTQESPIIWLLYALLVTVGPPFLVLSATAPLLQRWFSHTNHKFASDPYFLYAISNAGSMLALLAFPFLLEPALSVRTQSVTWAAGYAVFAVLLIACAVILNRRANKTDAGLAVNDEVEPLGVRTRLGWILCAFVPSSLMLGVTTYIGTDVASVPLIWVVPLALYLSTFILAFARSQVIKPPVVSIAFPVALFCLATLSALRLSISTWVTIALHLLVFFLAALVCHQRLAQGRPHVSRLPEFYLWIGVGGLLGGAFNALLAPLIFTMPIEYPIAIVLACLMRPLTIQERTTAMWFRIKFPLFVLVVTYNLTTVVPRMGLSGGVGRGIIWLVPLALCFVLSVQRPIVFGLSVAAIMLGMIPYFNEGDKTLASRRNFFGIWRVTTRPNDETRRLYHGTTIHGVQLKEESRKCEATSYYDKEGPLGQAFDVYNNKSPERPVAIAGLGAGTIATYSKPGQQFDFYDIDPAIVRIASDPHLFTFLSECTKGSHRVILGDARLKLREAPDGLYGLIVLDAFSSDSIPAHLVTTQALDLYLTKLSPEGVLAFHISNRYLNLEPLLSGLSRRAGLSAFIRRDEEDLGERSPSLWVGMARSDSTLAAIQNDSRWTRLQGNIVWTDDFSNILSVLK